MAGVIKQLATYDGNAWQIDDIGANANNINLTTSVAGQTNVQSALNQIVGTSALSSNRAIITDANGTLSTSNVTNTELGYLSGVRSNIQEQLDKYPQAQNKELYFENTKTIMGKTTENVDLLALQPCNNANNLVLGWGGYNNSIGSTNIYGNNINLFTQKNIITDKDIKSSVTTLKLGIAICSCILTTMGGYIYFTIPTGRVLSHKTISKITFNIIGRVGNSNNTYGAYFIRNSASGTDSVTFDSSKSVAFYNASNVRKTVTTSMWGKNLQGETNINISINGGTDYFFTGNSTNNNYLNNQPAVVWLSNITVTLS